MNDLNGQIARGAVWMVSFKLLERSIGLISTVILARLLVPADFGLVAMATAIIAVLELLGAFNFDMALIQNQKADRHHFDTVWTLNVMLGCFYALSLCALAYPAAKYYQEPRLEAVMYMLSLSQVISGFENIGVVAFRKELQFAREFRLLLAKKLATFCVTVYLAFTLRNYWALVVGILMGRLAGLVITFALHPYRPRFCLARRSELIHFSKWLLINNMLYFLTGRFSDFVIGKMVGMHALGIYSVSYELANLPTTELSAPINRAVFPGYSRLAGDSEKLKRSYLDVLGITACIAFPAGLGLIVVAEPLVLTILGPKWVESIPLFQMLAVNGILNAVGTNLGPLGIAMGKPRILTLSTLIYTIMLIPGIIVGAKYYGLSGAIKVMVAVHIIMTPIAWTLVLRQIRMKILEILSELYRPLVASMIMALLVDRFKDYLGSRELASAIDELVAKLYPGAWYVAAISTEPVFRLCACVLAGALIYATYIVISWLVLRDSSCAEVRMVDYVFGSGGRYKPVKSVA